MLKVVAVLMLAMVPVSVAAQQTSQAAPDAQQICKKEFGDGFKLNPKFEALVTDLDGDGAEDMILVATSKNPLGGEVDYHYRAIDPYDGYFGFGDPKITVQFASTSMTGPLYVLVIHNWKAPKAKFVIINLPFDKLATSRLSIKHKRAVNSIHAVEAGGLSSDVYWDGKKYKWEPTYVAQD